MRKLIVVLTICAGVLVSAGSASAAVVDGIFDLPSQANRLALGPDGNIWVGLQTDSPDVARVSPDGTVTPFTATDLTAPVGITAGPDGNMWATQTNHIVKFSPANPAGATKSFIAQIGSAKGITVGQDGNLWTGSDANIIRIPPATPGSPVIIPSGVAGFSAREITKASDGTLWVANGDGNSAGILPISPDGTPGTIVTASTTGQVNGVAAGPNGQVAYTQPNADPQRMGLINGGALAAPFLFPAPADPNGIVLGQDGEYWVAQSNPSVIGRYSTTGAYTKFADMPANSFPRWIAQGANNTIWVILERPGELFSRIARISGVTAATPPSTIPKLSGLSVSPSKFKVGKSSTALIAKKKTPTGTTFKFTLDKPATVFLDIRQKQAGKKSGKKCVKPTKKLRKKKNCTRTVSKGTLRRLGVTGANSVKFSGRLNKTKLKPGKYEVWTTAFASADGPSSVVQKKSFTVVSK